MASVIHLRGAKEAPRASVRSKMDTLLITPEIIAAWQHPPFQRPLRVNDKVRAIAEELDREGGVINGILTLGQLEGRPNVYYLMDGQHRIEAAKISGLGEFIADVRICTFDNMADMGKEYVKLNSSIVKMNPDDVLRGMEGSLATLHNLRRECPFVGYDHIRRNPEAPVLSMSAAIRCWSGARTETPKVGAGSALTLAETLTVEDVDEMGRFLKVARAAWGSDPQNHRLWSSLNLTMCMWLWRRLVTDRDRSGTKRYVVLNADLFKKCLMQVSANSDYIDWLVGRNMSERDRAPCYSRLRTIFVTRLKQELHGKKFNLPQMAWTH